MEKSDRIFNTLNEMFPNAQCELNYSNPFELLIAVCLSAQTTDKRVNIITSKLFEKYPTCKTLAYSDENQVFEIIKSLGLARTKTKNIIALSKKLTTSFNEQVPNTLEELISLPGCGRKSANVVLSEAFNIPAIAVDTHVLRVSNRLGLVHSESPLTTEEELMKLFPKDRWHKLHHLLIFFGRYCCKAQNPSCSSCRLKDLCKKEKLFQNMTK